MLRPSCVYSTSILDIEVATLITSSLYELACSLIEYIIHSATETITPLTHRICR